MMVALLFSPLARVVGSDRGEVRPWPTTSRDPRQLSNVEPSLARAWVPDGTEIAAASREAKPSTDQAAAGSGPPTVNTTDVRGSGWGAHVIRLHCVGSESRSVSRSRPIR